MSIRRLGGFTPHDPLFPDNEAASPQPALPLPHRPRAHGLSRARRPTARKRRHAESPDAHDPAAESEELLMMLDQHLKRDMTSVEKVDSRDSRGGQHGFDQDDPRAGGGANDGRDASGDGPARALPMRIAERAARDESVLLEHWRNARGAPAARAEAALVAVQAATRAAASAHVGTASATTAAGARSPKTSPTYPILAIVREFLQMPDHERTSRTTLASVRERLITASARSASGATQSASHAGSARTISNAEESMVLLLPIVLLNLGRGRTRASRASGIAALAALIRRGRGW